MLSKDIAWTSQRINKNVFNEMIPFKMLSLVTVVSLLSQDGLFSATAILLL